MLALQNFYRENLLPKPNIIEIIYCYYLFLLSFVSRSIFSFFIRVNCKKELSGPKIALLQILLCANKDIYDYEVKINGL